MNQIYLIKSGVMLDAVKKYIEDKSKCAEIHSEFAKKYGAERYFVSLRKLTALDLKKQIDGWTKPKRDGKSWPKKANQEAIQEINELPEMPNQYEIIHGITGVPTTISYKHGSGTGSTCIGSPLNECGFLYIQKHNLYAFWTPDVKKHLEEYSDCEITNGADKWVMDIDGIEPISESKWNLLVAECKVKDEEE